MTELRLYTFINVYLSSIQQGIQTAHLVHELFTTYTKPGSEKTRLYDWANNHKTIITLNGGANADIQSKFLFLMREARSLEFPAPFASFCEDEYSLGGVMTGCAVVLPETIYDAVPQKQLKFIDGLDDNGYNRDVPGAFYHVVDKSIMKVWMPNSSEARLIEMVKSCGLAR